MQHHRIHDVADLYQAIQQCQPQSRKHLGEILITQGLLTTHQLQHALQTQSQQAGIPLGDTLKQLGYCTQEQITAALGTKLGIPYVTLCDYEIPPGVLLTIPADTALQHNILPLAEHNCCLIIATDDPLNRHAIDLVGFHTNRRIEAVITASAVLTQMLEKYYLRNINVALEDLDDDLKLVTEEKTRRDTAMQVQTFAAEAQKKPVVRLVNAIIMQGIKCRASDIHIQPGKQRIDIFYRIDGKLHLLRTLSPVLLASLVSRIKITGCMDIAERRLPQDGHARVIHNGNSVDLRISVIPTVSGESVVIRILDKQTGLKPLDQLGLGSRELDDLRALFNRNFGLLLVTGPTGAGKSTTLYAILNEIRRRNPHIITVEDPVEYDMEGVEQIQTLDAIGYSFAEALRHILRHDPDVVMIGEIRDLETAHIANKAALTGHLVLSTLHTNDAVSTVARLIDMGVEPYLLSATLLGVMAQRLVRLNCPHCLTEEQVEPAIRQHLALGENTRFYHGAGCVHCHQSGYSGRAAVAELLVITPQMAVSISEGATTHQLKAMAMQHGMTTLTANALKLARQKKTSIEEIHGARLE